MKKIFTLFVTIGIFATNILAQDIDSLTLSKLKLNFVVPDMPAFKALGTEPSNLLRPSTPQALAVSFSEFYQDKQAIIPKAFAMEISPSLLFESKSNKSLKEFKKYSENGWLNSFRISLGSSTDSTLSPSGRNLALGFRINFINNGDLATDKVYQEKILEELRNFRKSIDQEVRNKFALSKGKVFNPNKDIDSLDIFISNNKTEFNKYLSEQSQIQFANSARLKELKEQYKKENWNANKLDFALAVLTSSPDSIAKNIRYNKTSLWLTGGIKIKNHSQILIGVYAQSYQNLLDKDNSTKDKFYYDIAIPARYLVGTNRIKGFLESQYKYAGNIESNQFLVNLGAELNLTDGLWINMYGGLNFDSKNSSNLITNFSLKYTLPENFNFF